MSTKIDLLAAIIALVASASVAGPALAGKPSNASQHGGKTGPTATLVVSPNPVQAWGAAYTVTGSGFVANQWVYFSTTCSGSFNRAADGNGALSFTRVSQWPGTCKYDAYQYDGRRFTLMATVSFEVVAP